LQHWIKPVKSIKHLPGPGRCYIAIYAFGGHMSGSLGKVCSQIKKDARRKSWEKRARHLATKEATLDTSGWFKKVLNWVGLSSSYWDGKVRWGYFDISISGASEQKLREMGRQDGAVCKELQDIHAQSGKISFLSNRVPVTFVAILSS